MNRKDLAAGQDYLASWVKDWQTASWARPLCVRVVTTEPRYNLRGQFVAPTDAYGQRMASGKVLVQNVEEDGTLGPERLISSRELRGPWAEALAEREAAREAQARATALQRERDDRDRSLRRRAADLAAAHGVEVPYREYGDSTKMSITAPELIAMLTALGPDWKYTP